MLAAAIVVAAGVPLTVAAPAQAAAYRYWSYWHVDNGAWAFSQVGAGGWRVQDGSVEGWHFAVSPNTRSAPPPRYAASKAFDELCGDTAKVGGQVRVALVLDFGVGADYPSGDGPPVPALVGDCYVVPDRSTGIDVLNEAKVSVRDQAGLVCALAGHPATGCGEIVSDPTPTPTRSTNPTRKPRPTVSPTPSRTRTTASGVADPGSVTPTPTSGGSGKVAQQGSGAATTGTSPPAAAGSVVPPVGTTDTTDTAAPDASPTLAVGMPVAAHSDTGTPWPALVVLFVVAGLGGAAYWWRRRSS